MSKRQSRRTTSYRAEVFERMRRHCAAQGVPMSAWVEKVVTAALNSAGAPDVDRSDVLAAQDRRRKPEPPHPGSHFTF